MSQNAQITYSINICFPAIFRFIGEALGKQARSIFSVLGCGQFDVTVEIRDHSRRLQSQYLVIFDRKYRWLRGPAADDGCGKTKAARWGPLCLAILDRRDRWLRVREGLPCKG